MQRVSWPIASWGAGSGVAVHGWPGLGRGLTAPPFLVLLAPIPAGEPSSAAGDPAVAASAAVAAKQQQKKAKAQRHFLDMEAELRWVAAGRAGQAWAVG